MSDKRVRVVIDDMNFYVKGNDNENYIRDLAKNLDEIIKKTSKSNYRLNQVQAITLSALNILDKLEQERLERKDLENVSENEKEALNKINENKSLKDDISKKDSIIKNLKEQLEKLEKKYKDTEEAYEKELNSNKDNLSEISRLKDEMKSLSEKNDSLNNKNNEAQKRIIDLSRELENTYRNRDMDE